MLRPHTGLESAAALLPLTLRLVRLFGRILGHTRDKVSAQSKPLPDPTTACVYLDISSTNSPNRATAAQTPPLAAATPDGEPPAHRSLPGERFMVFFDHISPQTRAYLVH